MLLFSRPRNTYAALPSLKRHLQRPIHTQFTSCTDRLEVSGDRTFCIRKDSFSSTSSERSFDPSSILPAGHGQVRIISNTTRDAQQSNLSAEMSEHHRHKVAAHINDVYKNMKGPPGYEQTWGGTVPMFDIWKRGAHPFESLRRMTALLPDTPQSALIRSNSLNAMGNLPLDVVAAFIKCAARAGVNVFTNFCAHNDWRNHVAVAEAVHESGQHYQGALSWAVHRDPTIYNVMWAVDLCREFVKLGAHSLYVKDPSGVLTPEMAAVLAGQLKEAFPELPLVFHTHYQTGYAYMTYLKAMEHGANGVECSLGMADGAGQPYSLTLLRVAEEMGWDTGDPDKQAKIRDICQPIAAKYLSGRTVRTPDIRVEQNGIAGGQRSILDKELRDAGQAHLIPAVDTEVLAVRDEGGKVCQVTPVADSYAREAMRRLRGGLPDRDFAPGYAAILTGEGGLVKEPVDSKAQEQALLERSIKFAKSVFQACENNILQNAMSQLVKQLSAHAARTMLEARHVEVRARQDQLRRIIEQPKLAESLQRKIRLQKPVNKDGKPFNSIEECLVLLQLEESEISHLLKAALPIPSSEYEKLIKKTAPESAYEAFASREANADLASILEEAMPNDRKAQLAIVKNLVANSGWVSCCASELQSPGLDSAEKEVRALDEEFLLGLTTEGDERMEENVVLQACYRNAAIPGLITNFFKNWRQNQEYWSPTYDADASDPHIAPQFMRAPPSVRMPLRRAVHANVATLVGKKQVQQLSALNSDLKLESDRLKFVKEALVPNSCCSPATVQLMEARVGSLQQQYDILLENAKSSLQKKLLESPGIIMGQVPCVANGKASYRPPPHDQELSLTVNILSEVISLET